MQSKLSKLRFRRRFKQRRLLAGDINKQAEATFERHFLKRLDRLRPIRRFVIGWLLLSVLLIFGVILQFFNLTNYYQKLQPVPGGTYREGILGAFTTANPLYATGDVDTTVTRLVFAGLFTYNADNKLVGDLAKNYDINATGTVFTVHLKPNLVWHDGRPLTSDDVAFTYAAIQNPDAKSPLKGSWQGITIATPDARTIVFTLPGPLASFPNTMTNGIVPKHILGNIPASELRTADFNTVKPVGAGPFKWKVIQVSGNDPSNAEELLSFTPFDKYQGGKPKVEKFIIHAYADQKRLVSDFTGGALNGMSGPMSAPEDVRGHSSIQTHSLLLTAGTYAFFKTTNPVLASQKVRQALVLAANPKDIINHLGYTTRPVRGPLLQGQATNDAALVQMTNDVAAAKVALDADGWTVGASGERVKGKQTLTFTLVATNTPEYRLVTKELQKQWRAIGVTLKTRLLSVQDFQNTLAYHDYDAVLYGISIGTDPDVFVYWDSSQADVRSANRLNLSEYKNPTADAALESGRTRFDVALRTLKYKPFLQAWQQDAPALGLYQPRVLYFTNGNVDGLVDQTVNGSTDRFNNVQNWMIREARVTNN